MTPREVPQELPGGVFTLSLDFELIWGTLDLFGTGAFREACLKERHVLVRELLALLERYEVRATWCILGHLMLGRCAPVDGTMHPEIVRPRHAWCRGDWFASDPGGEEWEDSVFLGRSLVERIRDCRVPQEIGCHSFSHVIFGDSGCSRATADSEVRACLAAAEDLGVVLRSFAFPRNRVGHLDVLRDHGFTSFRGPAPIWYEAQDRGLFGRIAHLWDVVRAAEPPVVLPELTPSGLWNIPGSMIYFPMHGIRSLIPISLRVRRAVKGLTAAVRDRRIFHLWFHPTNLADRTEAMLEGFEAVLRSAARLREEGALQILPMRALLGTAASAS